jgi:hypothetical protein
MKATIDAKTYNTETATLVAQAGYPGSRTDFRNWDEWLYRTTKGVYFLCGDGGPMSKYAEQFGNESHSGCKIVPMGEAEALAWCEKHGCENAIEGYFAHLVEEA